MTKYKVNIKGNPLWKDYDVCRIGISVGKNLFEGEKFLSCLSWVEQKYLNGYFNSCIIQIADTLQRHNLIWREDVEPERARNLASEQGIQWYRRYQNIIEKLEIPCEILYWDFWLNHPDYQNLKSQFDDLYEDNLEFKDAVDTDVEAFVSRQHTDIAIDFIRQYSREFLLEELACHTLMARSKRAAKLYPSVQLNCLRVVRNGLIDNAPQGLENEYYVRFFYSRRNRHVPMAA